MPTEKKKCKRVYIVCYHFCKKEGYIKEYMFFCSFVQKKYKKENPETNEIGYPLWEGGHGVKRMGEVGRGGGDDGV